MNASYDDREKQAVLDEYLVLRCQEGDADALQELMTHWHRRLYGYALGQLQDPDAAKDATQDSLVSISKGIRRLKDPATFPKWAYQIVIRRCADWQRKEHRWRARHVADPTEVIEQAVGGAADAAAGTWSAADPGSETDIEALRRAIALLEPALRSVVRLHYFDSFSVSEIGELLKVPVGTIKSRLYYARKKLKHTIGGTKR